MPKLQRRKDGGLYIRTGYPAGGKMRMVTYQVSAAGEEWLARPGCFRTKKGVGSELTRDEVAEMLRLGYLTTGGGGAGEVEYLHQVRRQSRDGCPLAMLALFLPVALLIVGVARWAMLGDEE